VRRAALLAAAFLSGGSAACGSTGPAQQRLTVAEVIDWIDRLNGRTVRVGGYLGRCSGYDCSLFASEDDSRKFDRFLADIIERRRSDLEPPPMLGIGDDRDFDRKAAPLNLRYVIITGIVDNQCWHRGEPVCTDRAPDLHPIRVEAWDRDAEGARS
jgi:hypothetical protein